jgi:Protein of unknown function (DUF1559)
MPRRDDDDLDDDDRPRRRRPRDDDEDEERPTRARRRARDDDDEDRPRRRKKKKSNTGLLIGILAGVFLVCCGGGGVVAYFFYSRVSGVVRGNEDTRNDLKAIGMGVHNCHDRTGSIPNNTYDNQGRPLLSWRVHLLPYVNEEGLYRQFNLNEPWDGPTNRRLLSQVPKVYASAGAQAGEGKTYYRGFTHQRAIFEKPRAPGMLNKLTFQSVPDGLANTIFVVEAGEAVEWTKPDDFDWSPGRPRPALGAPPGTLPYFMVLMVDGSVRAVRKDVPEQTLRALIGRNDGTVIGEEWEYR